MKVGIGLATFLFVTPSFFLPFFYEWGGFVIALCCTIFGVLVWLKRNKAQLQLLTFNVLGSIILTAFLMILISTGLS